jgi:hypothetical protein
MSATRLLSCGLIVLHFFATAAQAAGQAPADRLATLAHGINITRWFTSQHAPEFYEHYIPPDVFRQLKDARFTYLRVPLAPSVFRDLMAISTKAWSRFSLSNSQWPNRPVLV